MTISRAAKHPAEGADDPMQSGTGDRVERELGSEGPSSLIEEVNSFHQDTVRDSMRKQELEPNKEEFMHQRRPTVQGLQGLQGVISWH